jgi:hypothetical protein
MVGFKGELGFGLEQESSGFIPTLEQFSQEWRTSRDAVAFVEPEAFKALAAQGVPMKVIARDGRSVVISRNSEGRP